MSLENISWLTHIAWLVALDGEDDGCDEDGDEEDERDCHQQESPLQPTSLVPPGDLQDGDVNYPNKDVEIETFFIFICIAFSTAWGLLLRAARASCLPYIVELLLLL